MDFNNGLLNAGFALGGGLGSMPVALPYSLGGAVPGIAFQGGDLGTAGLGAMTGAALPMGMMNRDGQEFMGQQGGDANVGTENNPVNNAIYQMMAKGFQSLGNKAQQAIAPNTSQIIHDNNQFRFAGMQQNPQMLAQALRKR